jgi:hypothetical protein
LVWYCGVMGGDWMISLYDCMTQPFGMDHDAGMQGPFWHNEHVLLSG